MIGSSPINTSLKFFVSAWLNELINKYRGSYYLEVALQNNPLGVDFSESFEEARLFALSKELNHFVGLNTQEKTIPKEETFLNLVEDMFNYKDKEGKKIA